MSLTSLYYLLFISLVFIAHYSVRENWRKYILILSSLLFYYLNQKSYVLLLVASILVNYGLCHLWLKQRKVFLVYTAIAYNILILAFFKYLPVILYGDSVPEQSVWSRLLLPIGISFFSFQAIGYVLDLYWKNSKKQNPFIHFILYMSFFPQLLAGPIARTSSFMPQITKSKAFNYDSVVTGARLVLWGLFKKLVVANNLSPYTDAVFNNTAMHSGTTFLIASVAYTIQLYMDFSGYSDIAIGSAKVLGFNLIENFRVPLLAKSVTEFWRRWHISLSTWVRDYVSTPLQYKLRSLGKLGIIISTFITFLIIGIWHGANWNYVIFGLLQGTLITWELLTPNLREKTWKMLPKYLGDLISTMAVFGFFVFTLILLRVKNPSEYLRVITNLSFDPSNIYWGSKQLLAYAVIGICFVAPVDIRCKDVAIADVFKRQNILLRWSSYIVLVVLIILIGSLSNENFIYFQF